MLHKNIPAGEVHVLANWVVADATARGALTPVASDVGKVCWQQDDDSLWVLKDDSPLTWAPFVSSHSHSISDVTGLSTTLSGKVDSSALSELIDDRVAALLRQGSNVTITYDDTNGTLTVAAAAGGATSLDGLSDVTVTSPANGQVLKYNGSQWINDTDATGSAGGVGLDAVFLLMGA